MYVMPTAPRSVGNVLDDSLRLWRHAIGATWPLAILVQLLLASPVIMYRVQQGDVVSENAELMLVMTQRAGFALLYLFITVMSIGFYNAITAQTHRVAAGTQASVTQSVKLGFKLLPRALLLGAIMAIGVLAFVLFYLALSANQPNRVKAVVELALVLAACFWIVRLFLSAAILIVENSAAFASMRRSWEMTAGHWWHVAAVLISVGIAMLVAFGAIAFLVSQLASRLGPSKAAVTVILLLVSIVANSLVTPLYSAVALSVYYDLRSRR